MTKEEFSQRLGLLTDDLYETYEYFTGYCCLYDKIATNRDEMNTAPSFFQSVLKAFLEMFALKIAKLYDGNKEALSLKKLSGWIEQNKELYNDEKERIRVLADINEHLKNEANITEQIKLLRDRLLAHTDKKQLKNNIWEEAGLSIGNYRSLITDGLEIICICKNLINEPTPMLGMGFDSDIDTLMLLLKKHSGRE